MSLHYIPNILSILRIILVIPIVFGLLSNQFMLALILLVLASLTDALDGFIAKHFNCQTWLGSLLDPLADKILLTTVFISLYYLNLAPIWLLLIILLRDIILIAGVVGYYYEVCIDKKTLITPSNISKLNTALQILTVLWVITAQIHPILIEWLDILFIIVATSTLISGVDYAWSWIKKLW